MRVAARLRLGLLFETDGEMDSPGDYSDSQLTGEDGDEVVYQCKGCDNVSWVLLWRCCVGRDIIVA